MGKRLTESEKHERYKNELYIQDERYSKRIMKATDPDKIKKLFEERDRAKGQLQAKWFYTHKRGKIGK